VLAAALVLAVGSAVVAVISQQRADEEATVADANRLAALSSSARSLDLSLLLAVAAVRTADTPATRDSLLEALVEHRRATGVFDLSIGRLQEMALSEDGRTLAAAVGGASSFILVWEPGSGEPPRPVAPGLVPDSLTISPDGKMLVGTLPVDGEALKAFRSSGEEVKVPNTFAALGGAPRDVEFTESGRLMMFTSGARGKVQRFDLERGVVTPLLPIGRSGGSDAPLNAAFTDDASAVVVWSSDHRRAYWSRVPAGPPVRLAVQPRAATSLEFIATRTGALQLWSDGTVTRYDVQGRAAQELTGHRAPVRDAVLLPDGRGAVTAGAGGQVELWSVEDSGEWSLGESIAGHAGAAEQVEVSPDGQSVLTAARDGEVITWDVSGVGGFGTAYPGLTDRFVSNRVQVVEPGRLVVAPARSRPARPKPRALTPGLAFDHGPGTGSVAAVFWDPRDGRVVDEVRVGRTIPGYIFGSSVAVSPDRRWVAITSGFATTVLDAHTRERLARFPMPQGKLEFATCVAWTPDGSQLLIGSQGLFNRRAGMMVVDTERWELTRQVVGRVSYQVLEWAADGQTLAAGVNFQGRVHVYDAELRNVRSVDLGAGGDAWDLAFSPDGSMLAAARDGGGVTVVDTRSWRLVHETAPMHADHAVDVEWLPDGNTVVSTGVDEVASLYDVDRDLVRADPLPAAEVRDRGLTFLLPPTGEEIVVLNQDGPGRRYPLDPARWLADACEVAGRDLTPAEWDRYLPDEPYRPVCEVNVGKQSVPR
jgi:WD40 repeat protein